jgi:GNAT superfamily N-acetyltransferase
MAVPPSKVEDVRLELATARRLGEPVNGLEQWRVNASVPGVDGADRAVGTLSVVALDLVACDDPWGALDSSNEDISHIGDVVFDEMTGQLSPELDARLAHTGERVLVIDRVELEPDWRGHGVAALLLAETLDRMRAGVRAAVCLPAPLHRTGEAQDSYETGLRRMQQVWQEVGFEQFREGVWLLEPNAGFWRQRLTALRQQHGLG